MFRKKASSRRGFTLTEVMLAVAILAILAAVAIPGTLAARRKLKQMELNDVARQIYLSAQGELIARRSAGTLADKSGPAQLSNTDDGEAHLVLPAGSLDPVVAGNYYYIVVDWDSDSVLAVYYKEDNFTQDEIRLINADGLTAEYCMSNAIGRYTGEALENLFVQYLPEPVVTLVNGDELTLTVTVPAFTPNDFSDAFVLDISVNGVTFQTVSLSPSFGYSDTFVLDSLTEPFKDKFPSLIPGADITVKATLRCSHAASDTVYQSASGSASGNSLFAYVTGGTASIKNARHLQNLSAAHSGVTGTITAAKQGNKIAWSKGTFLPIENSALIEYDGSEYTISDLNNSLFYEVDGGLLKNIRLENPFIAGSENLGALAVATRNTTVTNCRVYGDKAYLSGSGTVGGLVGKVQGGTIENSFASIPTVIGHTVGGLVGNAQACTIQNCYAVGTLSGDIAGMLVGHAEDGGTISTTITSCYAMGTLSGTSLYGFSGGKAVISNSYTAARYADGSAPTDVFCPGGDATGSFYLSVPGSSPSASGAAKRSYTQMTGGSMLTELNVGWVTVTAADTHPYDSALTPPLPFPGLKDMPHYGDWPLQRVSQLAVYQKETAIVPVPILSAPVSGTRTFWAEPRTDDGQAAEGIPVIVDSVYRYDPVTGAVSEDTSGKLVATTTHGPNAFGRSEITIDTDGAGGVYGVVLDADGIKVWVLVIASDVKLTLVGETNQQGSIVTATNTVIPGSVVKTEILSLEAGWAAEFTAELDFGSLGSVEEIGNALAAVTTAAKDAGDTGSAGSPDEARDFAKSNWFGFHVLQDDKKPPANGPGVSLNPYLITDENGDPIYILTPHIGADGKKIIFPNADDPPGDGNISGTLTVVGQSAGVAAVSVCWAMDPSVQATCQIQVTGAQVAIKSIVVDGNQSDPGRWENALDYPYLLSINPRPDDKLTLNLTAELFNGLEEDDTVTYHWTVHRMDGTSNTFVCEGESKTPYIELTLENESKDQARYRISVLYLYKDASTQYRHGDFMYLDVYRKTAKGEGDENIRAEFSRNKDPNDSLHAILEQITWGTQVPMPSGWTDGDTNTTEICGRVDNAADPTLFWYLPREYARDPNGPEIHLGYIEGETEYCYGLPLSGAQSVVFVYPYRESGPRPDDEEPIAMLEWVDEEMTMTSGKESVGGHLVITALDRDDYTTTQEFKLSAFARDQIGSPTGSNHGVEKDITVTIMPKLKATPQIQTRIGLATATSGSFTLNRPLSSGRKLTPSVLDHDNDWAISSLNGKLNYEYNNDSAAPAIDCSTSWFARLSLDPFLDFVTYSLTLVDGPYQLELRYTAQRTFEDTPSFTVSSDGIAPVTNPDNTTTEQEYILIEKSTSKPLDFSWGCEDEYEVSNADGLPTLNSLAGSSALSISKSGGSIDPVKVSSRILIWSKTSYIGDLNYTLNATASDYGSSELTWNLKRSNSTTTASVTYPAHVVGLEFPTKSYVHTLRADQLNGASVNFDVPLRYYFPKDIVERASISITTEPLNSDVITVYESDLIIDGEVDAPTEIPINYRVHKYGAAQLVATYTVKTKDGREYVYKDACTITVTPPDQPEVVLEPCTGDDIAALSRLFGSVTLPVTYARYDGVGDVPTMFTADYFVNEGYDTIYLKAYLNNGQSLKNFSYSFYSENASLIPLHPEDIRPYDPNDPNAAAPADPTVYYVRLTAKNGRLTGDEVAISVIFGTLEETRTTVKVYSQPSVTLYAEYAGNPVDVTDRHNYLQDYTPTPENNKFTLTGQLFPALKNAEGEYLDDLLWYIEYPSEGYQGLNFLTLSSMEGPSVQVTVNSNPNSKAAVTAISRIVAQSDPENWTYLPDCKAAYALVFVPGDNP